MRTHVSAHLIRLPSIERLVNGYLISLQSEGKSPRTVSYYWQQLKNFLWWLDQEHVPKDLECITEEHIRAFLLYVKEAQVRWEGKSNTSRKRASLSTVRHYYVSLKVFFNWLIREGLVESSPLENIRPPKLPERLVEPVASGDVQRVLAIFGNSYTGTRNRAILVMLYDCGLRLSELTNLNLSDINWSTGTAMVGGFDFLRGWGCRHIYIAFLCGCHLGVFGGGNPAWISRKIERRGSGHTEAASKGRGEHCRPPPASVTEEAV